ncbi:hypothetical protein FHX37_4341 [Haloactinospora alba]|uniref:Carboxypeptidase family protein n=1 Tax=Haloactinospora alba TaxID=405555 RepID=A0A543N739_9ACTN|nr:hypothetical protein FHX37_4341 [Haloactinospora alba]
MLTGADGRYHWPLPPATYTLTAHCPEDGSGGGTGEVTGVVVTDGRESTADITVE